MYREAIFGDQVNRIDSARQAVKSNWRNEKKNWRPMEKTE